jgi:hypothetical protein
VAERKTGERRGHRKDRGASHTASIVVFPTDKDGQAVTDIGGVWFVVWRAVASGIFAIAVSKKGLKRAVARKEKHASAMS